MVTSLAHHASLRVATVRLAITMMDLQTSVLRVVRRVLLLPPWPL